MKRSLILGATTFMLASAAMAQVALDPDNTKFRIASTVDKADCKLSLREISRFDGNSVGRRYLCAQLINGNYEISLTELADLIASGRVRLDYAGSSAESVLATLNSWRQALIDDVKVFDNYNEPGARLSQIEPWTYMIVASNENETSILMSNSVTGEAQQFQVKMKQDISTRNK